MPVTIQPATFRYKANGAYQLADSLRGEKGDKGDPGATPQFAVGSIATGEAGSNASVTITGTAAAPVLNMSIPKGDQGNVGATPNLSVGTITTGAPGTNASVAITGTPENPVLNMSIPRGFSGPAGNGSLIAPEYYELVYPVLQGQHCIYDGKYYEANTNIATSESWNPEHWTEIGNIGDEIRSIADDLVWKAPAITDATASGYDHEDISSLVFVGNPYAWGNARYADAKNLVEGNTESPSGTMYGVSFVKNKNILVLNGTATSSDDFGFCGSSDVDIAAGTYVFKLEVHPGESVFTDTKRFHADFWYDDNTTGTQSTRVSLDLARNDASATFTLTQHVYRIRLWWGIRSGCVYSDYRVFYSILPSTATVIDTGKTVANGSRLSYAFASSMPIVDTMMHSSDEIQIIDTKTYVDNHIPNIDFVCFRPEDYGAKGDGIADDYTALQACINAAQQNTDKPRVVRGYGIYKISQSLTIVTRDMDLFINKIDYRGNDAAVIISSSFSNFEFNVVTSYSGGSSAAGIRCYQSSVDGYQNTFFGNTLRCTYLLANGNAIEFRQSDGIAYGTMMYNVFWFNQQSSVNGNVIDLNVMNFGENEFHGKTVGCHNGYVVYSARTDIATVRLHGYCIEVDAKNGFYNTPVSIHDYRTCEMTNQQTASENTKGWLYTFDGMIPCGYADITCATGNTLACMVNLDNALSFDDCVDEVKAYFEENPSVTPEQGWSDAFRPTRPYGSLYRYLIIKGVCCVANSYQVQGGIQSSDTGTLYAYYDNIAFKPDHEIYYKVNGNMTIELTPTNHYNYITPTTFDIDTASATITLDPSYCCIAINEFDVIQHAGKTAVVVDKLGNTIFNGANLGAGVFHFKCEMTELESLSVTLESGAIKNVPTSQLRGLYTGSNEKWTVTLSPVAATLADAQAIISSYSGGE